LVFLFEMNAFKLPKVAAIQRPELQFAGPCQIDRYFQKPVREFSRCWKGFLKMKRLKAQTQKPELFIDFNFAFRAAAKKSSFINPN